MVVRVVVRVGGEGWWWECFGGGGRTRAAVSLEWRRTPFWASCRCFCSFLLRLYVWWWWWIDEAAKRGW